MWKGDGLEPNLAFEFVVVGQAYFAFEIGAAIAFALAAGAEDEACYLKNFQGGEDGDTYCYKLMNIKAVVVENCVGSFVENCVDSFVVKSL